MRIVRNLVICCALLALVAAAYVLAAWRPALAPLDPQATGSFDAALVQRGATLAAIGDCDVCHTAPEGRPFAGGVALPTPLGTITSTNITPDPQTGIGGWTEAAFRRAMREGVRRDGRYLYPAFPYDHFTLVTDDDDRALYAFLMTREPVRAERPANTLPFPLNIRLVMFGWNLLFLREGPYRPDAARDAAWNRGAYLAEGLGHCGACHTPRNALGAETGKTFAGGEAEGWTAYALDASSPAAVPWTADTLASYLRDGFAETHGVARGPMSDVVEDLRTVPPQDVEAIAAYIAAQQGRPAPPSPQIERAAQAQAQRGKADAPQTADSQANVPAAQTNDNAQGAAIYMAACAGCHQGPRAVPYGGIDLALSSGVTGPSARNLVNVVLYGLPAAEGARNPIMPGFAAALSDGQLVALADYLRGRFTDRPPWNDTGKVVQDARNAWRAGSVRPAPGDQKAPPTPQRTSDNAASH